MHSTASRAIALANAINHFPFLGPTTPEMLLDWVEQALGHRDILDRFCPYGLQFSKATPLSPLLHIASSNTPHAPLQSLTRGLLLGAENFVKLPKVGVPEVGTFCDLLPPELAAKIQTSKEISKAWQDQAAAVIAFGSDETMLQIRKQFQNRPVFTHGRKVSFIVVFDDPEGLAISDIATAASLFDQQGCLSPHVVYVKEQNTATNARTYASRIADAMEAYDQKHPRSPISPEESASIFDLRTNYRFRSTNDPRVQIWTSKDSDHWTVIYEDDPWFSASPLNRCLFVKPLPIDLESYLNPVRPWLSTVGIYPCIPEHAETMLKLGVSRICPIPKMQFPPWTWNHDGEQTLSNLVRWVDFETD